MPREKPPRPLRDVQGSADVLTKPLGFQNRRLDSISYFVNSGGSRNPAHRRFPVAILWMPAFAGMTDFLFTENRERFTKHPKLHKRFLAPCALGVLCALCG